MYLCFYRVVINEHIILHSGHLIKENGGNSEISVKLAYHNFGFASHPAPLRPPPPLLTFSFFFPRFPKYKVLK